MKRDLITGPASGGRLVAQRIGRSRLMLFLAILGPGLIAAASDNDAGGITTWSVIGARFGYSMLWLLVVITPILALTQEMGARMGAVTGKGLAALIREKFSLRVTAFAMLALLVANFGTTVAEFSGVAAAFGLARIPPWAAVPPVALGVWLLVTRGSCRRVERVFLAMTAVYAAYFVAGVLAKPDWSAAARAAVVPHVQLDSLWLLTAIAAALVAVIPRLPLVKVMLLSQDINGILLPVILIYVLKIINDPKVMGEHVNGRVYNTIAWTFSLVLIGLSVTLVASPFIF